MCVSLCIEAQQYNIRQFSRAGSLTIGFITLFFFTVL